MPKPQQPKSFNSLGQMLEALRDLDNDMLPEMFDPAAIIGDIREKVDAIKWRLDKWKHEAEMIDEDYIQPLRAKRESILQKHRKLVDYVNSEMVRLEVEKIPGNMFRVQLQASPKSLIVKEPADAKMFLNYSEYVLQKTTYDWNKEALREALDAGESLTFAELKEGKYIRFWPQGGEK